MPTYRFAETKVPATKNRPCPDCGKKVRRSTTFSGTTNPFTTPPMKTPAEIRADLAPQVKAWQETAIRCKQCKDAAYLQAVDAAKTEAAAWNEKHPVGAVIRFHRSHDIERTGAVRGPAYAANATAQVPLTVDGSPSWTVALTEIVTTEEVSA